MIARECWGGGGAKGYGGRGIYTAGWAGDSNAYFHFSNPGTTKGKQGENGIRVSGWKMEK